MLNYPLAVYRGDTYRWRFVLWADAAKTVPVDLTGVAVDAWIEGAGVTVLTCAVTANQVDVTLPAYASGQLAGKSRWDLQLTYPSGDVQTIVSGAVQLQTDVTLATGGV